MRYLLPGLLLILLAAGACVARHHRGESSGTTAIPSQRVASPGPGRDSELVGQGSGDARRSAASSASGESDPLDQRSESALREISGTVRDAATGVAVDASLSSLVSSLRTHSFEGRWRIATRHSNEQLRFDAPGYVSQVVRIGGEITEDVDVLLEGRNRIEVRVVDSAGSPVSSAAVYAVGASRAEEISGFDDWRTRLGTTDESGSCVVAVGGEQLVYACFEGRTSAVRDVQGSQVELELSAYASSRVGFKGQGLADGDHALVTAAPREYPAARGFLVRVFDGAMAAPEWPLGQFILRSRDMRLRFDAPGQTKFSIRGSGLGRRGFAAEASIEGSAGVKWLTFRSSSGPLVRAVDPLGAVIAPYEVWDEYFLVIPGSDKGWIRISSPGMWMDDGAPLSLSFFADQSAEPSFRLVMGADGHLPQEIVWSRLEGGGRVNEIVLLEAEERAGWFEVVDDTGSAYVGPLVVEQAGASTPLVEVFARGDDALIGPIRAASDSLSFRVTAPSGGTSFTTQVEASSEPESAPVVVVPRRGALQVLVDDPERHDELVALNDKGSYSRGEIVDGLILYRALSPGNYTLLGRAELGFALAEMGDAGLFGRDVSYFDDPIVVEPGATTRVDLRGRNRGELIRQRVVSDADLAEISILVVPLGSSVPNHVGLADRSVALARDGAFEVYLSEPESRRLVAVRQVGGTYVPLGDVSRTSETWLQLSRCVLRTKGLKSACCQVTLTDAGVPCFLLDCATDSELLDLGWLPDGQYPLRLQDDSGREFKTVLDVGPELGTVTIPASESERRSSWTMGSRSNSGFTLRGRSR